MNSSNASTHSERPAIRLLHVATVADSFVAFFRGRIGYMRNHGFDIQCVSSPGPQLQRFAERESIPVHPVTMTRRITPFRDLVALWRICRIVRRTRPSIVHSHTPKGGLLGMIAAWICGVPVRYYTIRGLPYVTAKGIRGWILRTTERVSCRLAHRVLTISESMRQLAVADAICPAGKISVIGSGSSNGVDSTGRFNPSKYPASERGQRRKRRAFPADCLVIGFIGRVVRDKGIVELAEAWQSLRREFPEARLVLAGPFEPQDRLPAATEALLRGDDRVHLLGQIDDAPELYSTVDLVVLPTYREGFGNVLIEAAAMELPTVATRIPGCVDAVADGVTGTLVPPRDAAALAAAIRRYLIDPELRRNHGRAGRERAVREFQPERIWEGVREDYCRVLAERGLPMPDCRYQGCQTNQLRLIRRVP